MNKLKKLRSIIRNAGSLLIAFSGGVDSTFLLKVASEVLPRDKLLAVTADSATYPAEELLSAKCSVKRLGVRHKIVKTKELKDSRFSANPVNRCYFCKSELFLRLKKLAKEEKLNFVADASNTSDKFDFRPGARAKTELKIRSPLAEAGLAKRDIRMLSKKIGLDTWDKPALACLASRVHYGIKIDQRLLNKINQAENLIRRDGFRQVRVRHYNNGLCRIEVPKKEVGLLIKRGNLLVEKLKKLGYNYVTVDLEGYRTGSMNPTLPKARAGFIKRGRTG